ncbi:MAG: peptide chain release factor N(5)-glutamine methyltransferase [Clostridia bacterium]|nr:MAG: peptide chain release factor N(5)-glutamine methyltransferase [Clostridia bacterium]
MAGCGEDFPRSPMKRHQALRWAAGVMGSRLEAEVLLAYILAVDRAQLLASLPDELPVAAWQRFRSLVARRTAGWPLQYLTGRQEFMSLEFVVSPAVLIPRPDTEVLVEEALRLLPEEGNPLVVDVGSGSGAIGLSLAWYCPGCLVVATDSSRVALRVARLNAYRLSLSDRIKFFHTDLLEAPRRQNLRPQLVVSNPPYIPSGQIEKLPREVQFEPRPALDGGPDGLAVYRELLPQAAEILRPGGYLAVEVGWNQAAAVTDLVRAEKVFGTSWIKKDLAGRDRVVVARKE